MEQRLWFVVVTYFPSVRSLHAMLQVLHSQHVIEVRNSDEKRNIIQKHIVVDSHKNVGYAAGANTGIKQAMAQGAEWVVLLNQDVQVTTKSIDDIIRFISTSPECIAGPEGGSFDKKRWTTILPANTSCTYISGSCMILHRDVLERVGLLYEPYFMYYEDADYSVRTRKSGFPLISISIRGYKHMRNESMSTQDHKEYYLARNHMLFVERQAPIQVKLYEYVRSIWSYYEYYVAKNTAALDGVKDYWLRSFGERKEKHDHRS